MPTTLSAAVAEDCFIYKVEITNRSGGVRTVSAYTGNGKALIAPHQLADTEVITYYDEKNGKRSKGGVWWQADAAGCEGYVSGYLP